MAYVGLPDDAVVYEGLPEGAQIISQTPMLASHTPTTAMPDPPLRQTLANYARPLFEGVGAAGGAILGAGGGGLAGLAGGPAAPATVPYGAIAGGVAGAGLGYAAGSTLADIVAGKPAPKPGETAGKILTGAEMEMGGQATAPILGGLAKGIGYIAKPLLGRMSGVGKGAIEEAILSGESTGLRTNPFVSVTPFDKALRGKIKGDDVVSNAKEALQVIKDSRSAAYQSKLISVAKETGILDDTQIQGKLQQLMDSYRVKLTPEGEIDVSKIAMGKTGRNDIKEIIDTVRNWDDKTPIGLDTLKRQLDDFYSDSSQARQFVTSLKKTVHDTVAESVPEYAEMTKGYADATKIIKDIESGLMMRKQGMSGRVVADQTLRRLTSSMKDNFALRRELVDALGTEGGKDISGQVAGYAMRSPIPLGLAGTGPVIIGEAALAKYISPKFIPILVASSPRVQGEFLRMFGKGMAEAKRLSPVVSRPLGMTAVEQASLTNQ